MSINIRDVAKQANVSVSTVSKVLNNSSLISEATTAKVKEVINKLHYRPNLQAQNFARQKTHNISFIARAPKNSAFNNPHLFEIMCGVENVLSSKDYNITFVNIVDGQNESKIIESLIKQKMTDGIVIHVSAVTKDVANLLTSEEFPHIVIGKPDFESELCWIDTNNNLSGSIAVKHLFQQGFKQIAYIGGGEEDHISSHRLDGAQSAANELGIPISTEYIHKGAITIEKSKEITSKVIKVNNPDAIICANNTVALGTVRCIKQLGLSIPTDIAVVTFDDYPFSRIMEPPLTVVNIDVYDMGTQAGIMLLRKIKNNTLQVQSYTTLPVLIVRESTTKL